MIYYVLGIIIWFLIWFLMGFLGKMYYKRYVLKKFGEEHWDLNIKIISNIWVLYGPITLFSIIVVLKIADRTFMKDYK